MEDELHFNKLGDIALIVSVSSRTLYHWAMADSACVRAFLLLYYKWIVTKEFAYLKTLMFFVLLKK